METPRNAGLSDRTLRLSHALLAVVLPTLRPGFLSSKDAFALADAFFLLAPRVASSYAADVARTSDWKHTAFQRMCAAGSGALGSARWFADHVFDPAGASAPWRGSAESSPERYRVHSTALGCLRRACEVGRMDLAVWLADRFGIGEDDVGLGDSEFFSRVCSGHGGVEAASWVASRFDYSTETMRGAFAVAFVQCCWDGNLPVAKWLLERSRLTPQTAVDVCGLSGSPRGLHSNGRLKGWSTDFRSLIGRGLFWSTCAGKHPDLARWLIDQFALDGAHPLPFHASVATVTLIANDPTVT